MEYLIKKIKNNKWITGISVLVIILFIIIIILLNITVFKSDYDSICKSFEDKKKEYNILKTDYDVIKKKSREQEEQISELSQEEKQNEINNNIKTLESKVEELTSTKTSLENEIKSLEKEKISLETKNTISYKTTQDNNSSKVSSSTSKSNTNINQVTSQNTNSSIVYVTKTGKKYHKAGCSYLKESKIEMTLENAKNRGYTACSKCYQEVKMKNIVKKWWIWVTIVLITVVIIIFLVIQNKDKGVGTAGISNEEFEEIKIGKTTNFELSNIIDKNDEWDNDEIYNKCVEKIEESKEDKRYTYVYKYYGEKGGYAIITLQADYSNGYFYNDVIVIKKENFNLK